MGTGVNDPQRLAKLIAVNNSTVNPVWKENSTCSEYRGTDGQQFASGVTESSQIDLFIPDFCRSFSFSSQGNTDVNGVPTVSFKMNQLYNGKSQDDTCYCMKDNVTDCYQKGLFDIASCRYGSHIIISQPHFLNVEDSIIRVANNISAANETVDSSHLNIEPWTGAPLSLSIKLQINFDLQSYPDFDRNHTKQIVPLLWFEQVAQADQKTTQHLKSLLLNKITMLRVIAEITIIIAAFALFATAIRLIGLRKKSYV